MEITPLNNMVVVKRDDSVPQTPGGIYVPPTAQMKAHKGTVIAVNSGQILATGAGLETKTPSVEVGDVVLFREHAGTEVTLNGEDLLILDELEILVKVSQ